MCFRIDMFPFTFNNKCFYHIYHITINEVGSFIKEYLIQLKKLNKNISKIELLFQIFQMVSGTHYIISPRWCYSTQDYYGYSKKHYGNIDNEDIIPDWFFLPLSDECKRYREFTNNICS